MKIKNLRYLILPGLAIVMLFSFVSTDVFAQEFANPLTANSVNELLISAGDAVLNIVVALAVLMIVVAGIIYITSAGNQSQVELAKKALTAALIGLVLAIAAPSFLKEIYTILGKAPPDPSARTLYEIITETIKVAASLVGSLSVLMLVVGGIMYMVSGGDQQKGETAKKIVKFAIIGLVIAVSALIIVTQVVELF